LEVESVVQGFVVEDVLVVVFTVYLKACRYVGSTSGACCGVHRHQNEIKVQIQLNNQFFSCQMIAFWLIIVMQNVDGDLQML
jgi:hypothetical protein